MPQVAKRPAPQPSGDTPDAQRRTYLRAVSHELRTPLNSILGFSEILARELYGPLGAPQYKEYAEIIRGSGTRLLKLINQVLELAKLESGAAELSLGAEPVGAAVDDAAARLRGDMAERDVSLTVEPSAEEAAVRADSRALRTVIGNLLANAVAFSHDGGEVRVRAETVGERLDIVIEDDGEGVDPAELPRLVQPFEHAGRKAGDSKGGLGLAICDLTCRAMGGELLLESAPSQGFRARVRLPQA